MRCSSDSSITASHAVWHNQCILCTLYVLEHIYSHLGSCIGHISTTIAPMDLQPLSLPPSYAASCDAVATAASLHHMQSSLAQPMHTLYFVCIGAHIQPLWILYRPYLNNYSTYGPPATFIASL